MNAIVTSDEYNYQTISEINASKQPLLNKNATKQTANSEIDSYYLIDHSLCEKIRAIDIFALCKNVPITYKEIRRMNNIFIETPTL